MNRFEALGVAAEAAAGRRVAVICRTRHDVKTEFGRVVALLEEVGAPHIARRTSGRERIRFGNAGEILFQIPNGVRGYTADLVLVDECQLTTDQVDELMPVVMATGGEVVGV